MAEEQAGEIAPEVIPVLTSQIESISKLDEKIVLTWRKIFQIGAGAALESAVLALIFDNSTLALKIATAIVGLLCLLCLQFEKWLEAKKEHLFAVLITIFGGVYLCFVAYAIVHAWQQQQLEAHLRDIYASGNAIANRNIPPQVGNQNMFEDVALQQWKHDVEAWENSTTEWLQENLGPVARSKFSDITGMPSLCWAPRGAAQMACDSRSMFLNGLAIHERNLSTILEQMSVYSQ